MSSAEPEQTKPTRVLACALCKQRRVKCSRSFPCTNCLRAGVQCSQPTAKQRRRRFAERELLERLNHYEDLLRQNDVSFEPLHGSAAAVANAGPDGDDGDSARRKKGKEAVDIWKTIKRVGLDDIRDDQSDGASSDSSYDNPDESIKQIILANDHLLFGAPNPDVNLAAPHPDQVQIFRLWQIYLDNINPLLKVTHTPTLQPRIIDAASDIENISPPLEALMFSIYCAAVLSLTDDECRVSFHLSRDYLLTAFQVACKQALLKCAPWRSNNRDCLTAMHLFLISVEPQVDPRSLSCMVSVAVRIAHRMSMHCESSHSTPGCTALEAEMRRRLWWSLALFDHRVCEITGQGKSTTLSPSWDCRPPLNVNDFELRADMKNPPAGHNASATEAVFAVVRSELADVFRHSVSHLAIIGSDHSPNKDLQPYPQRRDLKVLEAMADNKHLTHCNEEIPLHYMTVWTTRIFIARCQLMDHYLTQAESKSVKQTCSEPSIASTYAIRMLESDTKLRTSPLTKGYLWLVESWYSPVLAHLHLLNGLAKQPSEDIADDAWRAVCDNYEALVDGPKHHRTRHMFALKFSRITLQAWEARETLRRHQNNPPEPPPRLVLDARANINSRGASTQGTSPGGQSAGLTPSLSLSASSSSAMFSALLDLDSHHIDGGQHIAIPTGFSPDFAGQGYMDIGMD